MVRLRYLKILLGGWILVLLIVCGLAAPLLAPFDPQEQRLESRLQPPTWMGGKSTSSWLGTDNLGRDILSRIIYGSRISLLVGATTVVLAGLIGCFLGAIAGYFGHGTDEVVTKITEIFLAFPFLLLAIALMAFLGQGVINIILALMMSRWVQYCRVVRGEVLSLKERDFVTAAKALGGRDFYVLQPEFSRSRRAGQHSNLGLHVERGPELYEPRSMAYDLSRAGDLHHSFRYQSAGRRAARYIGSEAAETSLAHKSSSKRSNGSSRSKS
jgi:binding-protein-dependent transport system inner membrane component/oligopeptide transport permease C-like protein